MSTTSIIARLSAVSVVFAGSLLLLLAVIDRLPVSSVASGALVVPRNLDDAKQMIRLLTELNEEYYKEVIILIFTTFVWLQMFALPGTIFFILGSGMLFSFPVALVLTALASAFGAGACYIMSFMFCRPLVERFLKDRVKKLQSQIHELDGRFFAYMIFIRVTPFLPNWLVNVVSPVIGVPFLPFFFGTLLGVIPPYVLFLRVGRKIHDFATIEDAMPWTELVVMWFCAVLIAVPVVFKDRLAKRLGITVSGSEVESTPKAKDE